MFYQKFGIGIPLVVQHGGPGLDQGYLLLQLNNIVVPTLILHQKQDVIPFWGAGEIQAGIPHF